MFAAVEVLATNNFGDTRTGGLAGPMGLFIIVVLGTVTVLLIRNMNARLRRLPSSFPDTRAGSGGTRAGSGGTRAGSGGTRAGSAGTGAAQSDGGVAPDARPANRETAGSAPDASQQHRDDPTTR